jgi:hypothetical protein
MKLLTLLEKREKVLRSWIGREPCGELQRENHKEKLEYCKERIHKKKISV